MRGQGEERVIIELFFSQGHGGGVLEAYVPGHSKLFQEMALDGLRLLDLIRHHIPYMGVYITSPHKVLPQAIGQLMWGDAVFQKVVSLFVCVGNGKEVVHYHFKFFVDLGDRS